MKYTISNEDIQRLNGCDSISFPKYTSQLINWANQNAQGTRPKAVGQLSDLFPEFQSESESISVDEWERWYTNKYPDAIEKATEKIYAQVQNLKEAIPKIDKPMVRAWVKDLVINKTFNGLFFQQVILASLAEKKGEGWRLANPIEEAQGIDGYVGEEPYQIKPTTYQTMDRLHENLGGTIILYEKTKNGLKIQVCE